jgi:hypothetical protein
VCALGPSSHSVDVLEAMLNAGMVGARIDLTWGGLDFHRESLRALNVSDVGNTPAVPAPAPAPAAPATALAVQHEQQQHQVRVLVRVHSSEHRTLCLLGPSGSNTCWPITPLSERRNQHTQ